MQSTKKAKRLEFGTALSLNISENDNSLNLNVAKEVAPYFRLSDSKVDEIINQVVNSVSEWKKYARKYGIFTSEQAMMETAFIKHTFS